MKSFLLKQFRLIAPPHKLHNKKVDILVESGKIKKIEQGGTIKASKSHQLIEEEGACVSPGWFDMQVHLSDPGFEYKETFAELNHAALIGGFTGLLCYPNTEPIVDNSQILRSLVQQSQAFSVDFHFSGALSHETKGKDLAELYEMNEAGALAFSDGTHPVQNAGLLLRALQYVRSFDGLIIDCPLDESIGEKGQMHEGDISTSLGMKGIPTLSETLAISRQLQLLDYSPARLHVQPISTPEGLSMLHASKNKHDKLSIGTAIPYLVMDDEDLVGFDPNFKLFPPLRPKKAVKRLRKAVQKGQLDVLTSGHQAQGKEEKNLQFEQAEPGMLSIQTCFSLANEYLIQEGVIDLADWVKMVSYNPRKILQIPTIDLSPGSLANFTLFHPEASWTFEEKHMPSRAKNSPLKGKNLKGKVLGVLKDTDYFSNS